MYNYLVGWSLRGLGGKVQSSKAPGPDPDPGFGPGPGAGYWVLGARYQEKRREEKRRDEKGAMI